MGAPPVLAAVHTSPYVNPAVPICYINKEVQFFTHVSQNASVLIRIKV